MNEKHVINTLRVIRNMADELIKQLETGIGTEVASTTEEPLENTIFNPMLFNTSEKLEQLKQTIGGFLGDTSGTSDRIDTNQMNQFFYLYAALYSRDKVLKDMSMTDFCHQMKLWFPEHTPWKVMKLTKALSYEKGKWKNEGGGLAKVTEWKKLLQNNGMRKSNAEKFEKLAMGIYVAINQLVKTW